MNTPARYKHFPPGWGNLMIPLSSREAGKAGLALYAPCRPHSIWLQRVAWTLTSVLGSAAIPGKSVHWDPPADPDTWHELLERLRTEAGEFDEMAIYQRPQAERRGLLLLLLKGRSSVAVAKILYRDPGNLASEVRALHDLWRFRPHTFSVPEPLGMGEAGEWRYLLLAPLPARPHGPPKNPPLRLISQEVQEALRGQARSVDIGSEWLPMHGDLTPWNLRSLPGSRLVLYDWESVGWGPPGADEVLYRATEAALSGARPGPSPYEEAVCYWKQTLSHPMRRSGRDRRLADRIEETLEMMLPRGTTVHKPAAPNRARVLVFAYACEPGRGSEPGTGWGLVRTLAEFADCTVLVAPEHMPGIQRWKLANDVTGLEFVEVGEPRFGRAAKWHRVPWFLVYMAWLRRAYRVAIRLHEKRPFDTVYHATYAVYWLPTPASQLGVPCVWGPVGGAARTPIKLWPLLGLRGLFDELLDLVSVRAGHWLPATRKTWRHVGSAMIQNEETLHRLTQQVRSRSCVLNHVLFIEPPAVQTTRRRSFILFPSSLEVRKGPKLAIHALTRAPDDVRLVFASDGPQQRALQRLANRLGVADRVEFRGRVSRDELFDLLAETAGTLFTGLREEGGAALAEAMLCGSPVIVLANGGARTVAGAATDPGRVRLVQPGGWRATADRLAVAMTEFSREPSEARGPTLDQQHSRRLFRRTFEQAMWSSEATECY